MLNLSFAGTLGADPETRVVGAGSSVTEFRVAVNGYSRKAKAKTTTWLKVTVWGQRGEQLAKLTAKGSKVAGSGIFEVESYETRDGLQRTNYLVNVQDLTLQSFVERDADEEPAPAKRPAASKGKPAPATDFPEDDDVPF